MLFGRVNREASLLRDAVFASSDGVVTTFAVVAGSLGANLGSNVVLILGFANLLADGVSMASGIYLGAKSEADFEKKRKNQHWRQDIPPLQGLVTLLSFIVSGFVPLAPYVFKMDNPATVSILFMVAFLLIVGTVRRRPLETVLVGGTAAMVAYLVGYGMDKYFIGGR